MRHLFREQADNGRGFCALPLEHPPDDVSARNLQASSLEYHQLLKQCTKAPFPDAEIQESTIAGKYRAAAWRIANVGSDEKLEAIKRHQTCKKQRLV